MEVKTKVGKRTIKVTVGYRRSEDTAERLGNHMRNEGQVPRIPRLLFVHLYLLFRGLFSGDGRADEGSGNVQPNRLLRTIGPTNVWQGHG